MICNYYSCRLRTAAVAIKDVIMAAMLGSADWLNWAVHASVLRPSPQECQSVVHAGQRLLYTYTSLNMGPCCAELASAVELVGENIEGECVYMLSVRWVFCKIQAHDQ